LLGTSASHSSRSRKYEKGLNRISGGRLQGMSIALGVPVAYFFPEPIEGESPEAQAEATLQ